MSMSQQVEVRMAPDRHKGHRWYLGGVASAGAAAVTHPLDLLKVSGWGDHNFAARTKYYSIVSVEAM